MKIVPVIQQAVRRVAADFGGTGPVLLSVVVHAALLTALAMIATQPEVVGGDGGGSSIAIGVQIVEGGPSPSDADPTADAEALPINPIVDPEVARQQAVAADRERMAEQEAQRQQLLEEQARQRVEQLDADRADLERQREAAAERDRQDAERLRAAAELQARREAETQVEDPFEDMDEQWDLEYERLPELEPRPEADAATEPDGGDEPEGEPEAEPDSGDNGSPTPGPSAGGGDDAPWQGREREIGDYRTGVIRAIDDAKRYPLLARRRGWQGSVVVRLVIRADGHLATEPVVEQGCRHAVLNREAVECVKRAAPFARIPANGPSTITIRLRIAFRLR